MIPERSVKWVRTLVLCSVVTVNAGCALIGAPRDSGEPGILLRNLQIETVDGHRAILLRLSRLPQRLTHSSNSAPASITVRALGPQGQADFEEQILPQTDPQVFQVRVARIGGELRVTLDLKSNSPPPYIVLEMADWIMIRLGGLPTVS